MEYQDVDAYYVMASMGDDYAFRQIFSFFYHEATIVIKSVLSNCRCKTVPAEEFSEYISVLFLEAINDFDPERAPFSLFVKYLIQLKMVRRVIQYIDTHNKVVISLDDNIDDNSTYHDILEDNSYKGENESMASKDFKYSMASKTAITRGKEKQLNDIKMLLYAGCTQKEIEKYLHLSRAQLRGLIRECKNDQSIINLKLEMK